MQHELKSFCTTENIDSKMLVMLDKWNHFSSQSISVLIATFKAFYVWKSLAKYIQVPDGKNKFIVKEFFKSVNIKYCIEYQGWSMGSNFSILQHWILKKVMVSFHSRFSVLREGRRNERTERAISCNGWTMHLDEPEEVDILQFSQKKIAAKWRINAHTWRVWACYLGSRKRLLHSRITGIRLDSDILLWSHYKNKGSLNDV